MTVVKIRTTVYLAVEGEGEQAFVKLLQRFSEDQKGLHVNLDCKVLCGGGYKTMLKSAQQQSKKRLKNKPKDSILLVDGDRGLKKEDGWTLDKLKKEAKKLGFVVCVQNPNQEGWLYRLLPGNENKKTGYG